jgi:hypothetical protein
LQDEIFHFHDPIIIVIMAMKESKSLWESKLSFPRCSLSATSFDNSMSTAFPPSFPK